LGWDQHQGRRWDSFHRNAVAVMLAYSFPDSTGLC
jgi:SRSO17 transposase